MRGLAEQIGVTVASLSEWNTGKRPIPDDRIQQLAKIAGQDAGPWLLLIHSEQDQGELGREWAKLYKRLAGAAMALFLMFGAMMPKPVKASEISSLQAGEWQQCILCKVFAMLKTWLGSCIRWWLAGLADRHRTPKDTELAA